MKTLFHTSTLLLVSLLGATVAPAGTFEVPFEFNAAGRMMPAGRYEVDPISVNGPLYRLRNRASGKAVLMSLPGYVADGPRRIVFDCRQPSCKLRHGWPQSGANADATKAKRAE